MSRQKWILLVLLLVLLLSVSYSVLQWPRQQRVGQTSDLRAVAVTTDTSAGRVDGVRLRTDLLEQPVLPPSRTLRNPFGRHMSVTTTKVVVKPAPPPPPPPPPVVAPVVEVEPVIPVETQVQLGRFTFRGYLEKDRVKTIFLSSDSDIFVVKKGDRFGEKGKFQVLDLSATELKIRQGDDPRTIVVPLVEQTTLVPKLLSPGRPPVAPSGSPVPAWRVPAGNQPVLPPPMPSSQPVMKQNSLPMEGTSNDIENQ